MAGLVALAIVGAAGAILLNRAGTSVAINDAKSITQLIARDVVEPELTNALLRQDTRAIAAMDRAVRRRVIGPSVARVKIWTANGRILYSDEHRLIGASYALGEDERAAVRTGRPQAEVSQLTRPENRFERNMGKLLEVYLRVRAPNGTPLLFEAYQPFRFVSDTAHRVRLSFLPALVIALVVLALLQLPLAWSLARRLRDRQLERETLLRRALDASATERRRIASDLHDGVVQDLAGLSMELAATANGAPYDGSSTAAAERSLRTGADATRQAVRRLRTLLVEIHPPNLHSTGLEQALSDLLSPLAARGIATELEVTPGSHIAPEAEQLMFRGAQEALRNVAEHAGARSVSVRVGRDGETVRLDVIDDGAGFSPGDRRRREDEGHLGLALLAGLVEEAGGRLVVESAPGHGARFHLEAPA